MNFLELINKCLLELNYKQVYTISELVKNDHKRIMTILNVVNKEICNTHKWNFLLRRTKFTLSAGETEFENSVNGRILYLLVNGEKYDYTDDPQFFLEGKATFGLYSSFANKLLFPKFKEDKNVEVIYYTANSVVDENGNEKFDFENATDCSLIPMPFAEQILVYGTCLRLKASPQYYKFSYWMGMYKEALANLRAKTSVSIDDAPAIKLFRS